MNNDLQEFAKKTLKATLKNCSEAQQMMFKRMYSHDNLEMPINDIIDKIPEDKLDWAMQQVKGTLDKKTEKFCDENCNECTILHSKNFKQVYYTFARMERINRDIYKEINNMCPNFTCCPNCHIDDFCHMAGECDINEALEKEFGGK